MGDGWLQINCKQSCNMCPTGSTAAPTSSSEVTTNAATCIHLGQKMKIPYTCSDICPEGSHYKSGPQPQKQGLNCCGTCTDFCKYHGEEKEIPFKCPLCPTGYENKNIHQRRGKSCCTCAPVSTAKPTTPKAPTTSEETTPKKTMSPTQPPTTSEETTPKKTKPPTASP